MQAEMILLETEFVSLWTIFGSLVTTLLILSWDLIRDRARGTMTQRRYSTTIVVLSAVTSPLIILLPLGVMAAIHPSSIIEFIGYLIAVRPFYPGALLVIFLMAVIGGWYYTRRYPVEETRESQSGSQPEPVDRPASSGSGISLAFSVGEARPPHWDR